MILDRGGSTHWPLTCGVVLIAMNISDLEAAHYSGCYVPELNPTKFAHQVDVREAILESVTCLRETHS